MGVQTQIISFGLTWNAKQNLGQRKRKGKHVAADKKRKHGNSWKKGKHVRIKIKEAKKAWAKKRNYKIWASGSCPTCSGDNKSKEVQRKGCMQPKVAASRERKKKVADREILASWKRGLSFPLHMAGTLFKKGELWNEGGSFFFGEFLVLVFVFSFWRGVGPGRVFHWYSGGCLACCSGQTVCSFD